MLRGSTTFAALVVFVAGAAPVVAQRELFVPPMAPERYAGPTILPFMAPPALGKPPPTGVPAAPPSPSPPSIPTGPSSAAQSQWALGYDGPVPRFAAGSLSPPGQSLGWYTGVDLGFMKPNVKNQLTTPTGFIGPIGNPIALPAAPLDWVAVPTLNFGYRFTEGAGELRLAYRLLSSAGNEAVPGLDSSGQGQLRSRLDVQTIDLDYISREFVSEGTDISRFFFRDLRCGFGLRATSAFFDSRASGTTITDAHVSSSFGGVGPRMFLELHQNLGRTDFQFYTRVSGNGVLGPIRQQFSQTALTAGGATIGYYDTHNQNVGIGIVQAEVGFSWEPNRLARRLRVTAAYSWERWWDFGKTDDSNAELTLQGVLLRAEYRY